jgi:alanine-glyoxylate transaminase/serine-glyoxylate transaminase/serine-pyruvate transaminase
MVVHNETSTGVTSRVAAIRQAIDRAAHPALYMVDTVSGLGSLDYRHAEWGIDVSVAGSQKGLMLPPGLSFNAVSDKALAASQSSRLPKAYWGWDDIIAANRRAIFRTPRHQHAYGLHEATAMLLEEGLDNVRSPPAPRRSGAPGRARMGPRDPVSQSGRVQRCRDRGDDARGSRADAAQHDPRALRCRQGLASRRARVSHRAPRFFNDLTLCGRCVSRWDWPRARFRTRKWVSALAYLGKAGADATSALRAA